MCYPILLSFSALFNYCTVYIAIFCYYICLEATIVCLYIFAYRNLLNRKWSQIIPKCSTKPKKQPQSVHS